MTKWFENCYSTDNVTISSRIRLARNIKNYPFPNIMTKSQINDLNEFILLVKL